MIFYDLWEFVRHISFLSSRFGYSRTIADHKVELGHFGAWVMDGVCVCVCELCSFSVFIFRLCMGEKNKDVPKLHESVVCMC